MDCDDDDDDDDDFKYLLYHVQAACIHLYWEEKHPVMIKLESYYITEERLCLYPTLLIHLVRAE